MSQLRSPESRSLPNLGSCPMLSACAGRASRSVLCTVYSAQGLTSVPGHPSHLLLSVARSGHWVGEEPRHQLLVSALVMLHMWDPGYRGYSPVILIREREGGGKSARSVRVSP